MGNYRSAQGKIVDMASLAARNQKTRAVGNMKVNARGDTIDSHGRIITPVTEKVTEMYGKTVGNKSANAVKKNNVVVAKEDLTDYEKELNKDLIDDDEDLEVIKAKEKGLK